MSEQIRENGDRHKANAARYLAADKPEYAAGSLRKAERNYAKAKLIDQAIEPVVSKQAQQIREQLDRQFIESVLDSLNQGDGGKPFPGLVNLSARIR